MQINTTRVPRTLLMSSLLATILVTACNDSKASTQANNNAISTTSASSVDEAKALVTSSAKIEQRNHVCFTMDVNNVKCVLGDTVAYVPQPIIKETETKKDTSAKGKKDSKNKDAKDNKDSKEEVLDPVLQAKQDALNEARPLIFVARYCDMSKPVVYSKEGVACTFKPHALYDAGPVAEVTQYQMNVLNTEEFFKAVAAIPGVEKFTGESFGNHGGYRIFLERSKTKDGLAIDQTTVAEIQTKRIDLEGNVLGFYHEELTFANLNPQMRILTEGLRAGDHVKLVFDTSLPNEQPLWRTSSLEFGQPYIWEVKVISVGKDMQKPVEQGNTPITAPEVPETPKAN